MTVQEAIEYARRVELTAHQAIAAGAKLTDELNLDTLAALDDAARAELDAAIQRAEGKS